MGWEARGARAFAATGGTGNADGVQGFGKGTFLGVAGFGDPSANGTGVFGAGFGPLAPGVRGSVAADLIRFLEMRLGYTGKLAPAIVTAWRVTVAEPSPVSRV